jgi:hypothetical protein
VTPPPRGLLGLLAEFETADAVLAAARGLHAEGYRRMDAYTPFPVEGLADALGFHRNRLPAVVLAGGLLGGAGGYLLQAYAAVLDYPLNVGGRPLHSWPAFIPITFELTILCAALAAVLGMLGLNGLPMPYHPVFAVERFEHASRDRFFLLVESRDPLFEAARTMKALERLGAVGAHEVYP